MLSHDKNIKTYHQANYITRHNFSLVHDSHFPSSEHLNSSFHHHQLIQIFVTHVLKYCNDKAATESNDAIDNEHVIVPEWR